MRGFGRFWVKGVDSELTMEEILLIKDHSREMNRKGSQHLKNILTGILTLKSVSNWVSRILQKCKTGLFHFITTSFSHTQVTSVWRLEGFRRL